MTKFILQIPFFVGLLMSSGLGWAEFQAGQDTYESWQVWIKSTPSLDNFEATWQPMGELPTKEDCESSLKLMVQEMANSANRGETDFAVAGETTILPDGRGLISLFKAPTSETVSMAMEFFCFPDSVDPRPLKSLQSEIANMSTEEGKIEQVNILMEFDVMSGSGRAALVWKAFESHTFLSEVDAKIAMAVMVYGRLLTSHADDEEIRSELFDRVTGIAEELIMRGKFHTPDWNLSILGHQFTLWPWTLHSATEVKNPRVYKATLIQNALTHSTGGLIDMGLGQERVLAPSAPLILIKGLSEELDLKDNYKLGRALLEANIKFGSQENALPTTDLIVTDEVVRKIPTFTEDNPSVQILGKENAIQMFQMNLETWNKNAQMAANVGTFSSSEGEVKVLATKPSSSDSFDSSMLVYRYSPSPSLPNGGVQTLQPLYLESKETPTAIILIVTRPDLEGCLGMVTQSLEIDIKKEMAPEFSVMSNFERKEFANGEFACVTTFHIRRE